jgi:hypothetical protein
MADKRFTQEYQEAKQSAAEADQVETRAKSARYDRQAQRVVVELDNGASFVFPPELAQGLGWASPDELANVRMTQSGSGLRWPSLDADFSLRSSWLAYSALEAEWQSRGGSRAVERKEMNRLQGCLVVRYRHQVHMRSFAVASGLSLASR